MEPTTSLSPERLLAHAAWIRRLAARLVRESASADDVAQQTLFEALQRPPRDDRNPRGWLASVARRVARRMRRSEDRRQSHELAAPRSAPVPAVDDALIRASLQRSVVDAVIALPEPYRSAILLRHLDELPTRRVAKQLGVPVETVRTRLKRGLALLRERLAKELDIERPDGGRTQGLAALAFLAARPGATGGGSIVTGAGGAGASAAAAGFLGVLAMSVKVKLAVAAAALAFAALAVATLRSGADGRARETEARATDGERVAPAIAAAPDRATPRPATADRTTEPAPPAEPSDASAAAAGRVVTGIVRDVSGAPVDDALVVAEESAKGSYLASAEALCHSVRRLFEEQWSLPKSAPRKQRRAPFTLPRYTRSDGDGRYELEWPGDAAINLAALHRERGLVLKTGVPLRAGATHTIFDLVLEPGVVVRGRVTDAQGVALRGANVALFGPPGSLDDFVTDENGAYHSYPLPWRKLRLGAHAEGYVGNTGVDVEAVEGQHEVVQDFRLEHADYLRGRVVTQGHAPLAPRSLGVDVEVLGFKDDPRAAKSPHAAATFGARIGEDGSWTLQLSGNDLHWVGLFVGARIFDAAPIVAGEPGPDLVLDKKEVAALLPAGALEITVVDAARSAPVAAGSVAFRPQSSSLPPGAFDDYVKSYELSAADGKVVARDLIAGTWYWITVTSPGLTPRTIAAQAGDGEPPPTVTVDLNAAKCSARGRVVDESAKGMGGCTITLIDRDGAPSAVVREAMVTSDAEGNFALSGVPDGEWFVIATPPRLPRESTEPRYEAAALPVRLAAGAAAEPVTVRLRRALLVNAKLHCSDEGIVGPFSFRILDEHGARIRDDMSPLQWSERYASSMTFPLWIAPGRYTLEVLCRFTKPARVVVDAAPDATVAVELEPSGR